MHPPPPASTLAAMNLQPGPLDRVVGLDDGSRESLLRVTLRADSVIWDSAPDPGTEEIA